jgi:hypothetical protein
LDTKAAGHMAADSIFDVQYQVLKWCRVGGVDGKIFV